MNTTPRHCSYCRHLFTPSRYHPAQAVCNGPDCQRRRCSDYHRRKVQNDASYREQCRDSQHKWRNEHPDYMRNYRRTHVQLAANVRSAKFSRAVIGMLELVKNNLAIDLKRSAAEVWLVGPAARDLEKNNLASCQMFIFQPLAPAVGPPPPS